MLDKDIWGSITIAELEQLASEYETPFFLLDAVQVRERVERVRNAFQGHARIYFAVKANPNLGLLRSIRDAVDGVDISSVGELEQVALAGYSMGCVSFAGPGKSSSELRMALQSCIGSISIESPRELREIVRLSREMGTQANIVVRVNPKQTIKEYGIKMGGRPIQFGIDEEDFDSVAEIIRAEQDVLKLKGIHAYVGSQCFDPTGIVSHVEGTIQLVREIEAATGLFCRTVNFGGGFGVSHSEPERELDVEALGQAIAPRLRDFAAGATREIIFELGRYLAADAGIYLTRVVGTKQSRGKTYIVTDGGLHHHLAAAGMFGVGLRSNYPLRNLTRLNAPKIVCNIAGPSCNSTDLLGVNVELASPQEGDLLCLSKSGAYALTASPLLFLGRPTAAELIRDGKSIFLGRRRRTITEFN